MRGHRRIPGFVWIIVFPILFGGIILGVTHLVFRDFRNSELEDHSYIESGPITSVAAGNSVNGLPSVNEGIIKTASTNTGDEGLLPNIVQFFISGGEYRDLITREPESLTTVFDLINRDRVMPGQYRTTRELVERAVWALSGEGWLLLDFVVTDSVLYSVLIREDSQDSIMLYFDGHYLTQSGSLRIGGLQ
jgi:hypothetical protein